MHKEEKSNRIELSGKRCPYFTLAEIAEKLCLAIRSIITFGLIKFRYGQRAEIKLLNSIRGKFELILKDESSIFIGEFIMSAGALYLKCVDGGKIVIGDRVFFNHNCSITASSSVKIGNNCNIANNVVIVDHDHKYNESGVINGLISNPVVLGDNVWIGANTTILKGVTIGDCAIVAAGSVVRNDIPAYSLAAGTPARVIKRLDRRNYDS